MFERAGVNQAVSLGPGDAGFAPRGSAHWLRNTGTTDGFMILMFDGGVFTNEDIGGFIGTLPVDVVASTLNATVPFLNGLDLRLASMVANASATGPGKSA